MKNLNRRNFLKCAAATTIANISTGCSSRGYFASKAKPNVVFILIDDMGWKDLSCYGSKIYKTPAIDQLANDGVLFSNAYAAHPMCLPSRVALMSGKYPVRYGAPGGTHPKGHSVLPLSDFTIAEAMKANGYQTFFAGKWHIGQKGAFPENQGFDINLGGHTAGQPASYFYPYKNEKKVANVPNLDGGKNGEYLTDRLTDETVNFIKANKNKPFFVYLSHYAVHTPLEAKKDLVDQSQKIIDGTTFQGPAWTKEGPADRKMHQDNATYAAMVTSVDDSVAKIRKTLKALDLDENTIIVFTSDNGGDACKKDKIAKATSVIPLRGGKCWMYEGGIRVPMIVRWPGIAKAGTISDQVVTGPDHYPAILEMAGLPLRPKDHVDGKSYAPILSGKSNESRGPVFWHFPNLTLFDWVVGSENCSAVRDGKYKLIEFLDNNYVELYDLENDIEEKHDLSKKMPQKTSQMHQTLINWRKNVNAPGPMRKNN
ncbi:MAG: sulfatase [Phycisphaerae bacterium]|nr:sulfatase [Phycisphaerae bacterium]